MSFRSAIRIALDEEMAKNSEVILLGEDIGAAGGVFKVTEGLLKKYGPSRVIDTPISENGMAGVALGLSISGFRPVLEIMFSDFLPNAMDQIVNEIAKMRYVTGGEYCVPLVIRNALGAASGWAAFHSQSLETLFMNVPGLNIAVPSTPNDAYGLLKYAIRNNNPTIFCEHKRLYNESGEVQQDVMIPFGKAKVVREGNDITVLATMYMMKIALAAADVLASRGIRTEVIDPRTLKPLDRRTIIESVEKTGRLLTVEENPKTGGCGAEFVSMVAEEAMYSLKAPVTRVCTYDVPIPFSPPLEEAVIPNVDRVVKEAEKIMQS
jgi:pyruvate/2-oxoglutarate/acetoin dehydrogenase E1 component